MGQVCAASRDNDGENIETAHASAENTGKKSWVRPTPGSPSKRYPYVMLDGKPKELGSGAYSTVLEATDKSTKEKVAIKKITKNHLKPHDHDALKSEVALLKECAGQANVLAFKDFFEEADYYYVVTEEVGGGELFERICDKETYTEHEARQLVKTLLQTLAFLHNKQIAHRDIKPENLLLKSPTDDTRIVLADFGFAVKCDGKSLNQVCGTPDYVAPEILKHQMYDYKCDVWSAGVIGYILLGGYAPFQARNPDDREELFRVIEKGKLVFHERYWSSISEDAKDLLAQMLNVDPDARPQAAALLRHKWISAARPALMRSSLEASQIRLKDFNAKKKLKSAVNTVKAVNTMKSVLGTMKATRSGSSFARTPTE